MRKDLRVYVDTSVVSIPFNKDERAKQTKPFWNAVKNGNVRIIVSDILTDELEKAPEEIRDFFAGLPKHQIEMVHSTEKSDELAARYIAEGVVGQSSLDDCKHIALATICHADRLVSWNFKHIVNDNKICGYNAVNLKLGYPSINILTPYILINDDEDEN